LNPLPDLFRAYLLLGLLVHKAVWEVMKSGRSAPARAPRSLSLTLVKTVKIAILLGIAVQTFMPDVLPLAEDPALLRVVGVILYTAGLMVALCGRIQLGNNWLDIEAAGVKREQAVVSKGIYRYVRHPIYIGDLALLIGLELALNSWLVILAALLVPVVLQRAVREESMLATTLPGYSLYCRQTKRFIPFLL
jgi:protein-S-isoprenylcysteine O-methyltransferase Ste14